MSYTIDFCRAIAVHANSYLRLSRSRAGKGGEGAGKRVAFADCAQSQSETQTGTGWNGGKQARSAPEVTFNAICACTLSARCLRLLLPLSLYLSFSLCVCASLTFFFVLWFSLITDQKSILTDNDWKKLWMRGGINADSKLDNNLDSSDSPMFEDSEVSRTDRQIAQTVAAAMECNEVCFKFKLN